MNIKRHLARNWGPYLLLGLAVFWSAYASVCLWLLNLFLTYFYNYPLWL